MFTFIDLFAGCGGLSLGLMNAGGQGLFAIEKHPDAFQTLKHNLIDSGREGVGYNWPSWLPITAHDVTELMAKHRCDLSGLCREVDVVVGGPPCQGYSTSGKRDAEDPRNTLFRHYVEFVRFVQPRLILLENVRGMDKNFDKSNEKKSTNRTINFAKIVRTSLETAGYTVHPIHLCSSMFGVPQKRSRFFLIGIRKDQKSSTLTKAELVNQIEAARIRSLQSWGIEPDAKVTVAEAISDLLISNNPLVQCPDSRGFFQPSYLGPKTKYQQQMRQGIVGNTLDSARLAKHTKIVTERFSEMQRTCKPGAALTDDDRARLGIKKNRTFLLSSSLPACTLTTLPDDVLHYSEPRILSVRESARLQSFPDWFEFKGVYTTGGERRKTACPRFTQVGNAVPIRLGTGLGTLIDHLLNPPTLFRSQEPLQIETSSQAQKSSSIYMSC